LAEEEVSSVSSRMEIAALLETLTEPGAASLQLTAQGSKVHPVLLMSTEKGLATEEGDDEEAETEEVLLFDLTAIRDLAPKLRRGVEFFLHGQSHAGIIKSEPLKMRNFRDEEGRLFAEAEWPNELELKQRRATFRASMRIGMHVGVLLKREPSEEEIAKAEEQDKKLKPFELLGDLRDLSASGCLVEFYAQDGASKVLHESTVDLEVCFPDGTRFPIRSHVRHIRTDADRQVLSVGFEFADPNAEQERQLWGFVREIEREASRGAGEGPERQPSPLFEEKDDALAQLGRRQAHRYATPAARRLARIAGYLDSQMVALRQGQRVNSQQLSIHAERLIALHTDGREQALFAVKCLYRESVWVTHCLSVALQLLDLLHVHANLPKNLTKAVVACAMIHDLGKGMLPSSIWKASTMSHEAYEKMQAHVSMVSDKLDGCKWLEPTVIEAVIVQINERLDGSGYPKGLGGDDLGQLQRAACIVDVIDAMRTNRPDRAAMEPDYIYQFMLKHPEQYDFDWTERYIRHFGRVPIGSLIEFENEEIAWVTSLNEKKYISEVAVVADRALPEEELTDIRSGDALDAMGAISKILTVDD